MKIHISDVPYLLKYDYNFRRRFKKLLLIGCFGLIIISVLLIIAGYFFLTPVIGFIFSLFPMLTELLFGYARGFLASFMMTDLLNLLTPLTDTAGVAELKGLIVKYFDQMKNTSGIDFQSFQNFISTIKSVVSDGQILPAELDTVRKLLPN